MASAQEIIDTADVIMDAIEQAYGEDEFDARTILASLCFVAIDLISQLPDDLAKIAITNWVHSASLMANDVKAARRGSVQ